MKTKKLLFLLMAVKSGVETLERAAKIIGKKKRRIIKIREKIDREERKAKKKAKIYGQSAI